MAVESQTRIYQTFNARAEVRIPNPDDNHVAESLAFYTLYYKDEDHDSPCNSRVSILRRSAGSLSELSGNDWVLDLGSGKQILEYENPTIGSLRPKIVTLDIADLKRGQLLGNVIPHVQASGTHLPFADNSFSAVLSNMAFDFMGAEARVDLFRLTKPGGQVYLNLHHPNSIIPYDLDSQIRRFNRKLQSKIERGKSLSEVDEINRAVLTHKKYLRNHKVLFESEGQIHKVFGQLGFEVKKVSIEGIGDKWWEVDMVKP